MESRKDPSAEGDYFNRVSEWADFFRSLNWESAVSGLDYSVSGSGKVFEFNRRVDAHYDRFKIADMRYLRYSKPHYHSQGESELYYVLNGDAMVYIGGVVYTLNQHQTIVTPPNKAHFLFLANELVVGMVSMPGEQLDNKKMLKANDPSTNYDHKRFQALKDI